MEVDQSETKPGASHGGIVETSLELTPEEVTLGTVLGDGSLGTVYKGVVRQNAVSIKVLHPSVFEELGAQDAFKREMEALSFIRHPNLALFMGYTLTSDKPMIVNELLKNNLEAYLLDKEKSVLERLRIAKEAALGLSWLHRNHLAHREMKPSNILLDANLHAKVSDYGLSRVRFLTNLAKHRERSATAGSSPDLATSAELSARTALDFDELPYWTAPELLATLKLNQSLSGDVAALSLSASSESGSFGSGSGSRISYEKCDIYSFGMIVWQLLTRREPFSDTPDGSAEFQDLESFSHAVVQDKRRPEIPADTLPVLQDLIKDCLDSNPNRRPPFQSIVKRLDSAIIDYAIRDPLANKFWKDTFLTSGGDTVKWKEFCNSFATFLGLTVPGSLNILDLISINHHKIKDTSIPLDIRCLHTILVQSTSEVAQHNLVATGASSAAVSVIGANKSNTSVSKPISAANRDATTSNDDTVSMEQFGKMMDWFGPIRKDARALILSRIREVLRRPWFHGDLPTVETEARIMTRDVGTFLVRFSNSAPGVFAISKVAAPLKVNHLRVSRDQDPDNPFNFRFKLGNHIADSLEGLVELAANDYGLLFPCANPPYAYLFAEQAPVGSYVEGNEGES